MSRRARMVRNRTVGGPGSGRIRVPSTDRDFMEVRGMDQGTRDQPLDAEEARPVTEEDRARSWWAGLGHIDPSEEPAAGHAGEALSGKSGESR